MNKMSFVDDRLACGGLEFDSKLHTRIQQLSNSIIQLIWHSDQHSNAANSANFVFLLNKQSP
jgi:hypothetical protein